MKKFELKEWILLFLVLIISSFSILNIRQNKNCRRRLEAAKNNIYSYEKSLKSVNKNIIAQYESEGAKAYNKVILKNGLGEIYSYGDIVSTKNKIFVIRIFTSGCSICLEEELIKIKHLIKQHKIKKVIYLMSHVANFREFSAFIIENELLQVNCFFLKEKDALLIPIDKRKPYIYLYLTDSTYKVQKIFVPSSNNNELNNWYFAFIKDLLKEKNE